VRKVTFIKKYSKTNIFIVDADMWKWAKYRAEILGYKSVAEYIFQLIESDKKEGIIKKRS